MMVSTTMIRRCSTAPKMKVSPPDLSFLSSKALTSASLLVTDDSDDGMEMDNEDYKVVSKGKLKSYEVEYESLSQVAVERLMQRDVDYICGILGVDVSFVSLIFFCTTNEWPFCPFYPGRNRRAQRVCCFDTLSGTKSGLSRNTWTIRRLCSSLRVL